MARPLLSYVSEVVTIKEGRKTEIGEMHIFAEDRYTLRSKKE
jgi:hypothetical protein